MPTVGAGASGRGGARVTPRPTGAAGLFASSRQPC